MNPNEEKFLEFAIAQNIIKESNRKRIVEMQKQGGLPLYSLLVKERILSIEQISSIQKSLLGKYGDEKKTIAQATQSLEGEITIAQDVQNPSLDERKTMAQATNSVALEQKKTLDQTNPGLIPAEKEKEKTSPVSVNPEKKFGRYTIMESLGEGGMGIVYKAYDPSLDRIVALKLITASRQKSKISIDRFLIEAKATAKLNHEHIVKIHDMGSEKGIYFFTMEFIKGDTLERKIKEKKISRQNAVKLFVKVCKAMDYAHSNGIIHRDMKPGNIMLDSADEPRIMDFGLAKLEKEDKKLSRTGAPIGTPAYMSPEQAAGKDIGYLSDVYSLGAILYSILTGIEPFHGDTLVKILEAVMQKDPVAPTSIKPGLSRDLEIICLKAMSKEPERRYQSAKELGQDVENFLEGDPILARPASFWYRYSRKLKKNKAISALICLCLVLGLGAFSFFWQEKSKRLQKAQETVQKQFLQAEQLSFLKDLNAKERLEDKIRDNIHKAVQAYSSAMDAIEKSEHKSQFSSLQSQMQTKRDSFLARLYEDAFSYYKDRLCQKALARYQDVRNTLYVIKESNISKEKIDTEISHLYQWLLEAEKEKDQAKTIAYNSHSSRQNIERAIALLDNALQKNQENTDAFYMRGLLYSRISQKSKAIEDFRTCLALEQDHFPSKYYEIKLEIKKYITSAEKQKELDIYIEKFALSMEKYSKEHKTYFYLIQAYQLKFQHKRYEAEQRILLSQKESPLLAEAYYAQANFLSYFLTGEETIAFDFNAYSETVSVFYNYEKVQKILKRAMELDPNNPLGLLLYGKLAWEVFAPHVSVEAFSRILADQPSPYLYFLRGCAYLDLEKDDLALADFQIIREKFQVSETIVDCFLCLLLEKAGRQKEAEEVAVKWKKERFLLDKNTFCQVMQIFFDNKINLSIEIKEKGKFKEGSYASKDIFSFLQIPFLVMACKSNSENEIPIEFHSSPIPQDDNSIFLRFFSQKKYASIFMEKDVFQSQSLLNDFYVLEAMKQIDKNLDSKGNFPMEVFYNSLFRFLVRYSFAQEEFYKKISSIFKKYKFFDPQILLAYTFRIFTIRQQSLLCRQEVLEFAESYYYRAMHFFIKKEWDRVYEDINMALSLSPGEAKYHYALAKILAYEMIENPQKEGNKVQILYHLEQAISLGLQPMDMPLADPVFGKFQEPLALLFKKYESFANKTLWKELWSLKQQRHYSNIHSFLKNIPAKTIAMPFLSRITQEEIHQYYQSIKNLNIATDQGKNIAELTEKLEKVFSPYFREKIQEKARSLSFGSLKTIRVELDNTGHFKNLQKAIDIASEGTTIELGPGAYQGAFILKSGITIKGSLNEKGEKTSIIQNDVHSFSVTGIEIRRVKFLDCAIQAPIYLRHSEVSFLNCSLHGGTFFSYGTSSIDVQKSHIKLSLSCFDQSHFVMKESQYGPELFANGLTFYDSSTGLLQKNHLCTHGTAHNLNLCQIHDHAKVHILQNLISSAKAGILMTGNAQAEIVENKIYITVIGIYAEKNARFVLSKNEIYQNVEYGISIPENLAISLEDNIFRENGKGDIERRKDK